ncbi:DNA-J related domain-containing protein [Shewanella sp. SP2S2-4]|jgi:DnaJ-domain-containing protein 1|uniref:DnaJ domain-containing protein n=1 Tax=Shewanella oncorhynchi TaxID=2726434 RepID=A0ABX1KGR4_9GAMM|nr:MULTISPECIES: DNA-J related domain-containing protein [Shewanella]MBP8118995.1 DnaJ domain-containing protein [Shewanella sp.]MBI1672971.1 DnaJ domain-containing protein [Shewanella sp. DW31]MBS0040947.1 DnaJ domain-containing protein [Shewanella sp. M16]MBW3526954.1 DnaJ domain-containing protein [Shewanella sp. NKUCC05_KAH]MBW3532975.1 DnaJ domain-containing protein [Shewanella sp. NKUCC06_TVS]
MLFAKPSLTEESQSIRVANTKGDNPLIWPLLTVLQASNQSWKIHHLATELQTQGLIHQLDENPGNDLFKRNFLLMNALFELQEILLPKQWLQVKAMEIQIFRLVPSNVNLLIMQDTSLREYYLDWNNYDTSENVVRELLEAFWSNYKSYIGLNINLMNKGNALRVFELDESATARDIRKQWRRLALKWHPDRPDGDAARFREVCEAWQSLRDIA